MTLKKGRIQCLAEMYACQWNNRQRGLEIVVFGIVTKRQGWRFYKLAQAGEVYETDLFAIGDMPLLLGALEYVSAGCARNVP